METQLNQLYDLVHTTLVPCHWLLLHACYAGRQWISNKIYLIPKLRHNIQIANIVSSCKPDITTHIFTCTLKALCVTNVSMLHCLAPVMGCSCIGKLLLLLGRKLHLILLAHGKRKPHMVCGILCSHTLTLWLNLWRLQESLRNLVTMLLPILNTLGSLGILDQCKLSMIMLVSLKDLPFNSCDTCKT